LMERRPASTIPASPAVGVLLGGLPYLARLRRSALRGHESKLAVASQRAAARRAWNPENTAAFHRLHAASLGSPPATRPCRQRRNCPVPEPSRHYDSAGVQNVSIGAAALWTQTAGFWMRGPRARRNRRRRRQMRKLSGRERHGGNGAGAGRRFNQFGGTVTAVAATT